MARINQRSEWLNRQWHFAGIDRSVDATAQLCVRWSSFTGCRAKRVLFTHGKPSEFEPSLRYADARVFKREVFRVLQPLLLEKEKIFHLPGSELLLVY